MAEQTRISLNSRVTLHFALRLADGTEIDSNFAQQPATFSMGDGSLLPGFEQQLIGCGSGTRKRCTLAPELAFGPRREENLQRFSQQQLRAAVDPGSELVTGMVLAFQDASGGELPGVISAVDGSRVEVDFNHPLAGHVIEFEFSIVDVETPA